MKRIYLFQVISIITVVLLSRNIANAASFSDVPGSHLNSDAISYVQSEGIVSGYPDGTYKPDNTINRAEFTKIIIGAQFNPTAIDNCIAENTQEDWTYVFFPDVPKNEWFAKYICLAKFHGVIKGYPDGTFKPNDNINFAEAAKIIDNAFGIPTTEDEIWYKPFVEKLAEKNAIPTTITGFSKNITRGEMAEMVYRLKANVTTKASLSYETIAAAVSDWLTYRNDIYGFEFQYPKGITSETEGLNNKYIRIDNFNNPLDDSPRMLSSGEFYLEISIYNHKLNERFSSSCTNADYPMVIDYEKVVLGTQDGYRGDGIMGGDSGGKRFALCSEQTDADFYIVGTENDEDGKTINKIFDTFKFIDTGTTATYRNDEYGFEFKYPKEWEIDQARTSANEIVFDIGIPESREAVAFAENTQGKTLEQLKADQIPDASVIEKQSEITIGGERALVIETTEMGRTLILFNHGANTYTLTTGGRRMIDEGITASFKFTDEAN